MPNSNVLVLKNIVSQSTVLKNALRQKRIRNTHGLLHGLSDVQPELFPNAMEHQTIAPEVTGLGREPGVGVHPEPKDSSIVFFF